MSRIALSPVLGYLVLVESYMLALGLFSLAGVSDLVSHLRGWFVVLGPKVGWTSDYVLTLKWSVKFEDKLLVHSVRETHPRYTCYVPVSVSQDFIL